MDFKTCFLEDLLINLSELDFVFEDENFLHENQSRTSMKPVLVKVLMNFLEPRALRKLQMWTLRVLVRRTSMGSCQTDSMILVRGIISPGCCISSSMIAKFLGVR